MVGLVALLAALTAGAASGSTSQPAAYKPVIGSPVANPVKPVAGRAFTASFRVTRSDTGGALTTGKMNCDPTLAGKLLRHTDSFRAGIVRVSLLVPSNAAGKLLKIKVTIRAAGKSATRVSAFAVARTAANPSLSIAASSVVEGNAGTTTLSLPVTLSAASSKTVSVGYVTSNGTATAPSDYTAGSGTLTFQPGQKVKTIAINVLGDTAIEQDETFTVELSSPVNAVIAQGTATGTIKNDDTAAPVSPGAYRGATVNGDYVFFTVLPNRTLTGFRVNNVTLNCSPGGTLSGSIAWTTNVWTIRADGSFVAEGSWSGSDVQGDAEYTKWYAKVTGLFNGASATGALTISEELNYRGTHFACSTVDKGWSATLQG
ncbi:MAG TPA: Calx-beta domain-containing protein [Gaiellaceae bacterium]